MSPCPTPATRPARGRSTPSRRRTTAPRARPNHGCTLDGVQPGPCFQDYPHIGADGNGVYVSTNEYDLFGPNYNAAQIFAFSKRQLAAHPRSISHARREPQPRRDTRLHGMAGNVASGRVLERAERHGVPPEHDRRRRQRDRQPDGNGAAHRPVGDHEHRFARHGHAGPRDHEPVGHQSTVRVPADVRPEARGHSPRRVRQRHRPFRPRSDPDAGNCSSSTSRRTTRSTPRPTRSTAHATDVVRERALWGRRDSGAVGGELKAGIAWFAVDPEDQRLRQDPGQGKQPGLHRAGEQQPDHAGDRHATDGQWGDRVHGHG